MTLNQTNLTEPITNLSIAPPPIAPQTGLQGLPSQAATLITTNPNTPPVAETDSNPSIAVDTLEQVTQETPSGELSPQGPNLVFSETTDVETATAGNPVAEPAAPDDGGRNVPFDFDPASLGVASLQEQAYRFKLVIADERGERTALERQMSPGEPVQVDLTVYGEATLQTYINDILFQAWNP